MATMVDTLENKGETTSEHFLTCSYRKGRMVVVVVVVGTGGGHSALPFQKSWEISIKTGFDHVIETPHQIKKKQIKSGTRSEK